MPKIDTYPFPIITGALGSRRRTIMGARLQPRVSLKLHGHLQMRIDGLLSFGTHGGPAFCRSRGMHYLRTYTICVRASMFFFSRQTSHSIHLSIPFMNPSILPCIYPSVIYLSYNQSTISLSLPLSPVSCSLCACICLSMSLSAPVSLSL